MYFFLQQAIFLSFEAVGGGLSSQENILLYILLLVSSSSEISVRINSDTLRYPLQFVL